ncbi:MAG: alanine racemase [Patescibacteria group bacterium]|nr:alanine racemase [Patescibacteria group bacterium]
MINLIRQIIKPKYKSLNLIEIIKDNLIYNLNYLYSLQEQAEIFPVLKSNAYGHGLKEVCKILNETPVKMVAVDSFPEAQIVYRNFKGKVLIIGEMPLKAYRYCKLKRTEFIVYNQETLKYLSRYKKKAQIHLFYNTGMNREGIDDLEKFINDNKKYLDRVTISGFCSHLAEADNSESDFNVRQEEKFLKGIEILNNNKIYPKWIHLGNSGGVFILKNKIFNAFRPGISFYGYNPFKAEDKNSFKADNLKPALRLFSTITAVHRAKTGDKISYNNSLILEDNSNIAVIPFGYFEGLDRRFSNCAKFLYSQGEDVFWAKIAGQVCMNLTCLNFKDKGIKIGDRVKLISEINNMENSVEKLSQKIGVINYEILVNLNSSIKRVIIKNLK